MRSIALLLCGVVWLAACGGHAPPPQEQPPPSLAPWREARSLPRARQELAVAVLGGRLWVAGGFGDSGQRLADFTVYDPAVDTWTERAPLPQGRDHLGLAAAAGALWAVGGNSTAPTASFFRYDAGSDVWSAGPQMPEPRAAAAVIAAGDTIFVAGGIDADGLAGDTLVFDAIAGVWSRAQPLPEAREHVAGALFENNPWTVAGRRSGADVPHVEFFDRQLVAWSPAFALPAPARSGACATEFRGQLWVLGGESITLGRAFATAHRLASRFADWTEATPLPIALHGQGCAVVGGKLFVVGGGIRAGLGASARVFVLD